MPDSLCTILSVGNELLLGLTADTNASYLCREATGLGWEIVGVEIVPDETAAIAEALGRAAERSGLILVTGGLGPTEDDRTRAGLASALGEPLREREDLVEQIQERFRQINRPMNPINRVQAMLPESATGIPNACGTAPGIRCSLEAAQVYFMPGVPREMREMFENCIAPEIRRTEQGQVLITRQLHIFGLGESTVGERIQEFMLEGSQPQVGTTVHEGIITVRLVANAPSEDAAREIITPVEDRIAERLSEHIFGTNGETMAECVVRLLGEQKMTLALAESCTGGMIASWIVDVPGASDVLREGVIAYANQAKVQRLGVPQEMIATQGAVSAPVAIAMARNAARLANADYAISVTGIAGPRGGTPDKPVGTVWLALATPSRVCYTREVFGHDRTGNRRRAATSALDMLRRALLGIPFSGEVSFD